MAASGLALNAVEEFAAGSRLPLTADADTGRGGPRPSRDRPPRPPSAAGCWVLAGTGLVRVLPGRRRSRPPAAVERALEAEAVPAADTGSPKAGSHALDAPPWAGPGAGCERALPGGRFPLTTLDCPSPIRNCRHRRCPSDRSPSRQRPRLTGRGTWRAAAASSPQSTTLEDEGRKDPAHAPALVESRVVAARSAPVTSRRYDSGRSEQVWTLLARSAQPRSRLPAKSGCCVGTRARRRWRTSQSLNGYANHDPFSAVPDSHKPILLASASPHLDDFLWQPDWMQPAGATHVRHRTMVAVDGADDPLALTAEAATGASAPGWRVVRAAGNGAETEP